MPTYSHFNILPTNFGGINGNPWPRENPANCEELEAVSPGSSEGLECQDEGTTLHGSLRLEDEAEPATAVRGS